LVLRLTVGRSAIAERVLMDAMIRISTGLRDAVQPPRCGTSLHITHSAY
jgi:hypothetical protein